jgi:hypothetical protein
MSTIRMSPVERFERRVAREHGARVRGFIDLAAGPWRSETADGYIVQCYDAARLAFHHANRALRLRVQRKGN